MMMSQKGARVLVVDDDQSLLEVMRFQLEEDGFVISAASGGEQALEIFQKLNPPVVVTDLKMPGMDGLALMKRVLELAPDCLVLIVTAFADIPQAVRAMRAGAFDFIPKPFDRDHLCLSVRRAAEHAALRREVKELKNRLGSEGKELLFQSEGMRKVVQMADRVANSDATVLIYGESGTGKELLARRIHQRSDRADKPFVAVNCGAIPSELLEAELFGHVRGAFTGAVRERKGRFLQADGGTLFLDEIAELPADLQPKLLRVLQERVVDMVGGTRSMPVDVRIVAATNRDLNDAVRSGSLRQDLYFRLNVIGIEIPPLRERTDDILPLAKLFLEKHSGRKDWHIPAAAARRLETMTWLGNVRELENLCQRIVLLSDGSIVREDLLPMDKGDGEAIRLDFTAGVDLPRNGISLEVLERSVIERALEMNRHNQSRTARFLRIPRHILLYRIEKFGIKVAGGRRHESPQKK